jgi:hypothetical protein
MTLPHTTVVRAMRRLRAAAGYHELGMAKQAMACLDSVVELGEIGPFRLAVEVLRAEMLKSSGDFSGAAKALENAARVVPAPQNQGLWLALSACCREAGDDCRAVNSLGYARGARPPEIPNDASMKSGL